MPGAGQLFAPGSTAVRRDVHGGRVWSATPKRVIADGGDFLASARWPGVRLMGPGSWVAAGHGAAGGARFRAVDELASGRWDLAPWTWRGTTVLTVSSADQYFSVELFFDPEHELRCWYVNFERPFRRTGIGIDTFDLLLDLVVYPDGAMEWKDEDEYRHARRLGVVSDAEHVHVERAREQAVALAKRSKGPFADMWRGWRADPAWPLPRLPRDWCEHAARPEPVEPLDPGARVRRSA